MHSTGAYRARKRGSGFESSSYPARSQSHPQRAQRALQSSPSHQGQPHRRHGICRTGGRGFETDKGVRTDHLAETSNLLPAERCDAVQI